MIVVVIVAMMPATIIVVVMVLLVIASLVMIAMPIEIPIIVIRIVMVEDRSGHISRPIAVRLGIPEGWEHRPVPDRGRPVISWPVAIARPLGTTRQSQPGQSEQRKQERDAK